MLIGDKTLDEWREFAHRDDCLDKMVPSDLRAIVKAAGAALVDVGPMLVAGSAKRVTATEAEREACAKIADTGDGRPNMDDDQKYIAECIASAIRKRSNTVT